MILSQPRLGFFCSSFAKTFMIFHCVRFKKILFCLDLSKAVLLLFCIRYSGGKVINKKRVEVNRKNIYLMWLIVSLVSSTSFSLASIVYWEFTHIPQANESWRPINDALSMLMMMPFGWLMSVLTPAGWLNILGLFLAFNRSSFKPLVLSALGFAVFGLFWPKYFVGMMGI